MCTVKSLNMILHRCWQHSASFSSTVTERELTPMPCVSDWLTQRHFWHGTWTRIMSSARRIMSELQRDLRSRTTWIMLPAENHVHEREWLLLCSKITFVTTDTTLLLLARGWRKTRDWGNWQNNPAWLTTTQVHRTVKEENVAGKSVDNVGRGTFSVAHDELFDLKQHASSGLHVRDNQMDPWLVCCPPGNTRGRYGM